MKEISKLKLPDGNTYGLKDEEARAQLEGANSYIYSISGGRSDPPLDNACLSLIGRKIPGQIANRYNKYYSEPAGSFVLVMFMPIQ